MSVEQASGARAFVEYLRRRGVRHVFGLCGHTVVAVLDELGRSPVRFVGVHHEQMAAHAADAYARLTGRASVVLVHLGPGLTNAITGIAEASLDSVPVVLVAGNVQSYFRGRHAHMETTMHADADQAAALAPWAKRIWRVERPEALLPALRSAFRVAESGRPGPVLLDVAMDVFSRPVDLSSPVDLGEEAGTPASRAAAPRETVLAAAELLRGARAPVLYAGGGVLRSGGSAALRRIAERLNAPVAYSTMGKGAISDSHPLTVGLTGFWGTPAANAACRDADVLLAVGTQFGETDTSSWAPGATFAIPPTRLVHVHDDPAELGRSYRPELAVAADAGLFLEALADELGEGSGTAELSADLRRLRRDFEESLSRARASDEVPMRPERVLADLRAALPPEAVIVADTGWNKNGVAQQFPMYLPGTFVVPGNYATMGFGPAAALGATLANRETAQVALVGDGAFLTNLSVIQTAVEERLPVVWAVMNNGTYATISGMQQREFGSEYGSTFDASGTDYAAVARALGAGGARIEHADDLVVVLKHAIDAGVPYVIDIPTTRDPVPATGHWDVLDVFKGLRGQG